MLKAVACASTTALALPLALILPMAAGSSSSGTTAAAAGAPAASAKNEIPPEYLRWYLDAAHTCPGLPWNVLAAIGSVESDHGRSQLPGIHSGVNSAGAGGPMQFLAATWATYGIDGDHDGHADRYNPADAIYGAAHYLCANGAGQGGKRLYNAIFRYNHADWYVRKVLAQAAKCAAAKAAEVVATGHAGTAVRAALRWLGTPYSWGGGGPAGPSYGFAQGSDIKGFDCSSLTQHAWAKAGIRLPRIAADQYNAGPHIPRSRLQPGDLIFFATTPANPHTIHHVGTYLTQGRKIHAPSHRRRHPHLPLHREHEYAGATRPSPLQTHQT